MKIAVAPTLMLVALCRAAPATLGIIFDKRADAMPTLTLPYATYQAASYNADGDVSQIYHIASLFSDIYSFRSIRSRISDLAHHQ